MTSRFGSFSKPLVGSIATLVLVASSCTADVTTLDSVVEPAVTTSAPLETTEDSGGETTLTPMTKTETTVDTDPDTDTQRTRDVEIVDESLLAPASAGWALQEETFFVFGVEPDDSLNVRSGPGVDQPVVATIGPDSGALRIYDFFESVGNTTWVPVAVSDDGLVGWVSGRFLRPEPPEGSPTISGEASDEVLALMDEVLAALGDSRALSELVGSEGLTISPFAHIGSETLTLSKDEVANDGAIERTWGSQTGTGDPIIATLTDYLTGLGNRSALVSTVEIGYDEVIGGGNSINNLDEIFPTATVVEYNHPGTSVYSGLDWTSVRFVFTEDPAADTAGGESTLVLRALVSDQWEI